MPQPAPAAPKPAKKKTAYNVLEDKSEGSFLLVQANVDANNAEHAIRLYAEKKTDASGVYIAVPSRSWKPTKVAVETTTTLKLEEA